MRQNKAILRTPAGWLEFLHPAVVISTHRTDEVRDCLEQVTRAAGRGYYAVGFLSYEAGPAFDPAMETHPPGRFPLLWFGIYETAGEIAPPPPGPEIAVDWQVRQSRERYRTAIEKIHAEIAAGNTYQVNYTIRQQAFFSSDPETFFWQKAASAPYGAFVDTGAFQIISASPELFFQKDGPRLTTRPMKGTARRGRWLTEDKKLREQLAQSEKNRAENAMIADMLRNDLGRIARPGSVAVADPFRIEKYPTVWQMTTTVSAESEAGLPEIFGALFPCGSITGAPKISTMRIIRCLEDSPRDIYTGAIGLIEPDGRARFSVAIRTALVDAERETIDYGIGGGIVWDSRAEEEWEECRIKSLGIRRSPPPADFRLLETLRWDRKSHYFLLDKHLRRLRDSALYFDFTFSQAEILCALREIEGGFPGDLRRVRLLLSRDGGIETEDFELSEDDSPLRVALAGSPVSSEDPFLYHKTTFRQLYDKHLAAFPDADEVLLYNERGELSEACRYNLALKLGGQWFTPPREAGLLGGTYRELLLENGQIREKTLMVEDLARAGGIALFNSVRGWRVAISD